MDQLGQGQHEAAGTVDNHPVLTLTPTLSPYVWPPSERQGKLVDMFVGMVNEKQLTAFVDKLLKLSPVPAAPKEEVSQGLVGRMPSQA